MHRALLVGINDYASPDISNLRGCTRDVQAINDYISKLSDPFQVSTLLDKDATRENIIHEFRIHLKGTPKGKIAFFYFSGHGSRELAHWDFSAQQGGECQNETLVCHNSRVNNTFDLVDKELAILIQEVAKQGVEVVIMLDSCHSGSATRISKVRPKNVSAITKERPIESYLEGQYTRNILAPVSKHIVLSACDKEERAYETEINQEAKGIFTHTILKTLQNHPEISYVELFEKCRIGILAYQQRQTPQLECYGYFDPFQCFLQTLTNYKSRKNYLIYFEKERWWTSLGWMQGLSLTSGQENTLAVHQADTLPDKDPLAYASILSIHLDKSILNLTSPQGESIELDREKTYQGVASHIHQDKLMVYSPEEKTKIDHLAANDFIQFSTHKGTLPYQLTFSDPYFLLSFTQTDQVIAQRINPLAMNWDLRKLRAWDRTLALNPTDSFINPSTVPIEFILQGDQEEKIFYTEDITLDATDQSNIFPYAIKIRNRTSRRLYVALLYMSRKFSIKIVYSNFIQPTGNQLILSSAGSALYLPTQTDLYQVYDIFKVIISDRPLDAHFLVQNEIGPLPGSPSRDQKDIIDLNQFKSNWQTVTIKVRTIKELGQLGKRELVLLNGRMRFGPNNHIQAGVSIYSPLSYQRGAEWEYVMFEDIVGLGFELLDLSENHSKSYILDLHELKGKNALLDHPIDIMLNYSLPSSKYPIPFTYDGTHFWNYDLVISANSRFQFSISHVYSHPDDGRYVKDQSLKLFFLLLSQSQYLTAKKWVNRLIDKNDLWTLANS